MRKMLRDGLSCGQLNAVDTDAWNKNKSMTCAKISDVITDNFTTAGNPCLTRSLLETEQRFFGSSEEENLLE